MSENNALPAPATTLDDQGYWDAMERRELVFRQCTACSRFHHPPLPICPHCQSPDLVWTPVQGTAELFTYTIVHHAAHPSMLDQVPYVVAVVLFRDMDDIRVVGNLAYSAGDDEPSIGEVLTLDWTTQGDPVTLPLWHRTERTSS